ncbi:hypothetical protein SARC_06757 [Sphaeroforma arctica JP610]|uniref:C2H2-type domain-containing protein n=1 Tax=Sphaeroforma arctica JP610 TaxID=667725 RepID=A0A0L0FVL9_9EUKA|nr:hypothetical protein SARC_06757 [Sphaeroforma arctica JP610]KNC80900.1 hypothetical protein SARC_06757 [Sphaeroforma arctica JP610]|eukprot:XP_014154802.1 hypothetical protein SARC_06757 [Sphaeroforma arctica JP610]
MHFCNRGAGSLIEEMDQNNYRWPSNTGATNMFNFDRTFAKQQVAADKPLPNNKVNAATGMVWEAEQEKPTSPTFLNLIEELQRASAPPTQTINDQIPPIQTPQLNFECDGNQQAPQQPQSLNNLSSTNKSSNSRNPFVMGGRRHTLSSVKEGVDNIGSKWLKTHARPPAQPNSPYSGLYAQKRQSSQPKLPQYTNSLTGDDPLNEVMDFLGRTDINAPASMQRGYSPKALHPANEGHRSLSSMGRRATYNGGNFEHRRNADMTMDGMLQDSNCAAMWTDHDANQRASMDQGLYKVQDLMLQNRGDANLNVIPQDLWSALQRNQGDNDLQQQRNTSLQDEHLNSGFFQSDSNLMFGHSPQNGDYSSPNSMGDFQHTGQKKGRRRRTFAELSREFTCTYPDCARPYASAHSLQQHIRIKHTMTHPTLFKGSKKTNDDEVNEKEQDDEFAGTGSGSDAESIGKVDIKEVDMKEMCTKNGTNDCGDPVETKAEPKKKSFASNIISALHKKKMKEKPRTETFVAA